MAGEGGAEGSLYFAYHDRASSMALRRRDLPQLAAEPKVRRNDGDGKQQLQATAVKE